MLKQGVLCKLQEVFVHYSKQFVTCLPKFQTIQQFSNYQTQTPKSNQTQTQTIWVQTFRLQT